VDKLAAQLDELARAGEQLRQWPTLAVTEAGTTGQLLGCFARLRPLVQSSLALRTQAQTMLAPLVGLAANLTGAMRDISLRIKFIALNAQIQAVQNGCGTGLEVLSQRACQISDEVGVLSQQAAGELDRLLGDFSVLNASSSALHEQAAEQARWFATEGAACEARLEDFRAAGQAQLNTAAEVRGRLQLELHAMRAELDFHQTTAGGFAALLEPLEELTRLTPAPTEDRPVTGRLTEELQSQYTMASEHSVLATALAAPGAAAALPGSAAAPAGGTVELF
jgi:hypothetical protein